jgi:X-X-X-Leu-X-X-Gly heptad repeat protein
MKTKKPLICLALALTLLVSTTACSTTPATGVGAANTAAQLTLPQLNANLAGYGQAVVTDKEEVVYALLGFGGNIDNAYVVNHFKLAEGGYLSDYGNYQKANNLTNTYPITIDDQQVAIAADQGDFYYEGDVANPVLPWQVDITYKLDGKAVAAAEAGTLAGKSGRLELSIATTQNPSVDASFYENYALQVSLALDASKSSNLNAPDATVVAAGGDRQITYTVLPGSDGDLSFAADVVDFAMPGIQIAAVPFSMSFELPDTSSISDQLGTLVDAISALSSGASELDGGSELLASGVSEFTGGVDDLAGGVSKFSEGATSFSTGATTFSTGVTSFSTGAATFSTGVTTFSTGVTTFSTGMTSFSAGAAALKEGAAKLDAAAKLASAGVAAFKTGLDTLNQNSATLAASSSQLSGSLAQIVQGWQAFRSSPLFAGLDLLVQGQLDALFSNLGTVSGGYTALDQGISSYTSGVNTLDENIVAIAEGLAQLSAGVTELSTGAAELSTGATELSTGAGELSSGAQEIAGGASELSGGASELSSGASALNDGAGLLNDGASQLKDGTSALALGTAELYGGVQDMPQQIQDKINEFTAGYDFSGFEPHSFLSPDNKQVSLVQFVIKTPDIELPDSTPAPDEATTEKSFWDNLTALFS